MTEQTTDREESVDDVEDGDVPASDGSDLDASDDAASEVDAVTEGDDGAPAATTDVDEGGEEEADAGDLAALRGEFEALNDRHLRLVAEFNNFRRRSEQERMAAWGRAQADLVGKLLDVLDDLQRVADLDLSNASVDAIMEGIDLVERKFMRQLEEAGVEVMAPEGEPFDPERMEAMMRVPAEDDDQVDTVAQVFQKGYALKGTLVRPARVSVYTQG